MSVTPDQSARWKECIVEHSQFPRAHLPLEQVTHEGRGDNPFCGDRVTVQLVVGADDRIREVGCQSVGCAISMASASLLASSVKNCSTAQAHSLFERVRDMLITGREPDALAEEETALGDLEALLMVRQYPSRVKCATLAWHALKHALAGEPETASTE